MQSAKRNGNDEANREVEHAVINGLRDDLRQRTKPSVIRQVRQIKDWREYLGRPDSNSSSPGHIFDFHKFFRFGFRDPARMSLMIHVDGDLLAAALVLREGKSRTRGPFQFIQCLQHPRCFRRLEAWLRNDIGIQVPSLRENSV